MDRHRPLPKTLFAFMWHFVRRQGKGFLLIQLMALTMAIEHTAWPYAYKLLIDAISHFAGDKANVWHVLWPVVIFWLGLWFTVQLMFCVQGFAQAYVVPRFQAQVRMAMFDYISHHSYDFFANHFAGNLANKVSDMTQSSTAVMRLIIMIFVPACAALVIACVMFFYIDVRFAWLLLCWSLLHVGICFVAAPRCVRLSKDHATARSVLTGKIVDAFTNIINIKLFARNHDEYTHLGVYQDDERRKNRASQIVVELLKVVLCISAMVFPGALMFYLLIVSWQQGIIQVGDVVLILTATSNIQMLVWYVGSELPNFFKEMGVCQQALSLIQAQHDIVDTPHAKPLSVSGGSISFRDVGFSYPKGQSVFDGLTVDVAAGSRVGLVGYSGSGKSSFVNLIMRFFELKSGQISIDGQALQDVTVSSLRQHIAMIPQDPSLFHRSLYDNIRYGDMGADKEAVMAAAKHAHCDNFISTLPDGYDTLVGERGIKLSGGQRQRVTIARAILKDAPILILDEATSALDSVTEQHIQQALAFLMRGRTTLVIAHRLSTLAQMDRILVFDKGRIIEDGNHQDLLQANGHYAAMWHMQAGGFLPDVASC